MKRFGPCLNLAAIVAFLPWMQLAFAEYPWLDRVERAYVLRSTETSPPWWRIHFYDVEGLEIGSAEIDEVEPRGQIDHVLELTARRRLVRFPIFQLQGERTLLHYIDEESRICTMIGNVRLRRCRTTTSPPPDPPRAAKRRRGRPAI